MLQCAANVRWMKKDNLDDTPLPSLALLGFFILLYACVQLAYASLTNLRLTVYKERAEEGSRQAKRTLRLVENLSQLYITTHLLVTLIQFVIITISILMIAQPMIAQPESSFTNPLIGYLVVLIPVGLITVIFGDLIPSIIGRAAADSLAAIATPVMMLLMFVLRPLILVLNAIQALVSQITGGESLEKHVTEEEIMSLVDVGHSGGTIEPDEKEMIYSVLQFNETTAREIMIPRPDITSIEIDQPLAEALSLIVESGHSRIPVYDSEIDDIQGILFAKDLLTLVHEGKLEHATIRHLMRKAHFVPESKRADDLFREMQQARIHIAIIVDEYGSTAGLVTIEDLIEEIVGDIRDEYDQHEEVEFIQLDENTFMIDGTIQLTELNERLDADFSTEDNDTLGGYIYSRLGLIPQIGHVMEVDDLILRIERVENRRIRKVHVTRRQPAPPADPPSETGRERVRSTGLQNRISPGTVS